MNGKGYGCRVANFDSTAIGQTSHALCFRAISARTSSASSSGTAIIVTLSATRGLALGELLVLGLVLVMGDHRLHADFVPPGRE